MFIYRLVSPSTKSYIGRTIQSSAKLRFKQHVQNWKRNRGGRKAKLYCAFDKHPPEQWKLEILFETDDAELLQSKEIEYITEFNTIENGYNQLLGGNLSNTGQTFDDEHKNKLSESRKRYFQTPEGQAWREELSNRHKGNTYGAGQTPWNKGKTNCFKHSEETKQRISELHKGKPKSEEHKRKISEAKKGWMPTPEHMEKCIAGRRRTPQSDHQRDTVRRLFQKEWEVIFPDQHTEIIVNLRQFCRTHQLDAGNLQKTQWTTSKHKGYRCKKM